MYHNSTEKLESESKYKFEYLTRDKFQQLIRACTCEHELEDSHLTLNFNLTPLEAILSYNIFHKY